jgi:hypothetical protein
LSIAFFADGIPSNQPRIRVRSGIKWQIIQVLLKYCGLKEGYFGNTSYPIKHWGGISGTLRVQFGNNSGTDMLEQYGDFGKIDVIDGFSPLFRYLLIYRTEEVAGTSPERSSSYSKQDGSRDVNH